MYKLPPNWCTADVYSFKYLLSPHSLFYEPQQVVEKYVRSVTKHFIFTRKEAALWLKKLVLLVT